MLEDDLETRFGRVEHPLSPAMIDMYVLHSPATRVSEHLADVLCSEIKETLHVLRVYAFALGVARGEYDVREDEEMEDWQRQALDLPDLEEVLETQTAKWRAKAKRLQHIYRETMYGTREGVRSYVATHLLDAPDPTPPLLTLKEPTLCTICQEVVTDDVYVCPSNHPLHDSCAIDYVTAALYDTRAPSLSLQCPCRCDGFFVFSHPTTPPPTDLTTHAFTRKQVDHSFQHPMRSLRPFIV